MAEPARPPFRADHVGSLIRPKDARQAGIPEAEDLRFDPLIGICTLRLRGCVPANTCPRTTPGEAFAYPNWTSKGPANKAGNELSDLRH